MDARLLVGNEGISDNPKLNNLVKGWAAAKYDWIVTSDSNVLIAPDYIDSLRACWSADTAFADTAFACSPPVGIDAEGTGAKLEAAFLNTYQARWQLVADVSTPPPLGKDLEAGPGGVLRKTVENESARLRSDGSPESRRRT